VGSENNGSDITLTSKLDKVLCHSLASVTYVSRIVASNTNHAPVRQELAAINICHGAVHRSTSRYIAVHYSIWRRVPWHPISHI